MNIIKALLGGLASFLRCMADISGTVTDTGATPIPGSLVQLETGGQSAITGLDGSFTLIVATGVVSGEGNRPFWHNPLARIRGQLMCVNVPEKSAVEITSFDFSGKTLSRVGRTMHAGANSIVLPNRAAGIYLYRVAFGNRAFVIKSISAGTVMSGSAEHTQSPSLNALTKKAMNGDSINDVIAATKTGYLNYRMVVTNGDTSGMAIHMIVCADTVRDADGNLYQAVRIGNQIWTTENLRTTKYNGGSKIPWVPTYGSWDSLTAPGYSYADLKYYGALYNRYAVNTRLLAPVGWHVPTNDEWDTLKNYLVGHGYNWDGTVTRNKLAQSLCAKVGWGNASTVAGRPGNDPAKNNRTGFSALPGGYRWDSGTYGYQGWSGSWLSLMKIGGPAKWWGVELLSDADSLSVMWPYSNFGFSVRILKDADGGTMTDIDGNSYRKVRIGNQVWTAENLRTTRFNDGSAIPLINDSIAWSALTTPGYCCYRNTNDADSIKKFGMLYNWFAIDTKKIAPAGWHVPTKPEMDTLINFLIDNGYASSPGSLASDWIGKSLAARTDWDSSSNAYTIGYKKNENNTSGFSMPPGGCRGEKGGFASIRQIGYWWTNMEYDTASGYCHFLTYSGISDNNTSVGKKLGCSVRLLKD